MVDTCDIGAYSFRHYYLVLSSSLRMICRHHIDQGRYCYGNLYFCYYGDVDVNFCQVKRLLCPHRLIEEDHSY